MLFDDLNVPVTAQKNDISSLRCRCHWKESVSSPHSIRS
jgi:hypothetical protein